MKIQNLIWHTRQFLGLVLAVILTAQAIPSKADESKKMAGDVHRPKICLVLSGGGARGAAHVGVLKVLEEYHVPIDCIIGTSMGALIGGAYASGMSVTDLIKISASLSTEKLFRDNPPRAELAMRRKQDDYNIFVGPEVGAGEGASIIGKGAVSGVQLEAVLRELSKAKGFRKFDEFPIPFRAVATDLVTGKKVVFSDGELANVMRASMSVPGAVAPAELGGMILVDGMLTSNLPVETAREMGADIIIAVNVGTPLLKREELNNIFGVTGQMLSILTEQNVKASLALLKPTDVLITPELGEYSTGDFDHLQEIWPLGEVAARKVADRLSQLSISADEYAELRQREKVEYVADLRPVDEIRFENLQRVNPRSLQAIMRTQAHKPIEQKTLDQDMSRIYGTGDFEHVTYKFLEEPGRRVLVVDAVEKSWGPDYFRFGLGLSSDFSSDAYFNVLTSYRKTWINSLGAEWRSDLQIGHTSSLSSEFYQPINVESPFFVAPHAAIERRSANLYQGSNRIASYQVDSALAGVDVGTQLYRYGEFRLGAVGGRLNPSLETGPQSLSPGKSEIAQGAYTGRLILDQLDSAHFPRSGWRGGMSVFDSTRQLGADSNYTKWDADGSTAYSFGENTFNISMKVGSKIGSEPLPRYDQFQWGGFLQQSGYATGQLIGQNLSFGRIMYYRRILRGSLFEGTYGGMSLESGRVGNPLVAGNPDGWLESASAFVATDTPIGPAYLGYGRAVDGNDSFYFYLGRPF